jgi:hypothetical protein
MAKAALVAEISVPEAPAAQPDVHVALRGIADTVPARAGQGPVPLGVS